MTEIFTQQAVQEAISEHQLSLRQVAALEQLPGAYRKLSAIEHIVKNNLDAEQTERYICTLLRLNEPIRPPVQRLLDTIRRFAAETEQVEVEIQENLHHVTINIRF